MADPRERASRALTVVAELAVRGDDDPHLVELLATLATVQRDLAGDNAGKQRHRQELDERGQPVVNDVFRPGELPDTHFTRLVVIDDRPRPGDGVPAENRLPYLLVWESNHDGDTREYLERVHDRASRAGAHLDFDRVFGRCQDYPGLVRRGEWLAWMREHAIRAETFYAGYRGVAKSRVDAAERVHVAIRDFLDRERRSLTGLPPLEIHRRVHAFLRTPAAGLRPGDLEPAEPRGLAFRLQKAATYAGLGVFGVPFVVAIFLPWYVVLRYREQTDEPEPIERAVHGEPDLIAAEDKIVQNQLTHLVDLKPGFFRAFTLRLVLFVIDQLAQVKYVDGRLGGIASIHFARWVLLRDPRDPEEIPRGQRRRDRLLFFSNYDFSWDSYLGEFVDRAATGLTAVWSHTEGFPRTYRLLFEGAKDEEAFKQWARNRQIPSQVWWSGVRHSTVENVNNSVEVHRGAMRELDAEEAPAWVRRL